MTSRTKAPDGLPWPLPFVGVPEEPSPWSFGRDDGSLVASLLEGPWPCAGMPVIGYQLLDGHGVWLPKDRAPCIVRKSPGGIVAGLTAEHDRFIGEEMPRLAQFRVPVVLTEAPIEWLLGGRSVPLDMLFRLRQWVEEVFNGWRDEDGPDWDEGQWECYNATCRELERFDGALSAIRYERDTPRTKVTPRALLGSVLSIFTDHRVLPLMLPDRQWAEYSAAWILRRGWRRWLTEEWDAGRRESLEAVRAQRAGWSDPSSPSRSAAA